MTPRRAAIVGLAVGLGWILLGPRLLEQGFDLERDGLLVYGASVEATGTPVHARIETGDAPLRYQALGAWMRVFGVEARAAATFGSLCHGLFTALAITWAGTVAGVAGILTVLVISVAQVPVDLGLVLALLAVTLAMLPRARALPSAGAVAALTLLTSPVAGLALLTLELGAHGFDRRRWRALGAGAAAMIAVAFVVTLVRGAAAATVENTLGLTWSTLVERATRDGFGLWRTLSDGAWLHQPFAGLDTGERLGGQWPAHSALRALTLRTIAAVPLLTMGLVGLRARVDDFDPRRPLAWSTAALVVLVLGADVPAILVSLWASAAALLGIGRRWRTLGLGLALLALPLAAESAWLWTHADRSTLTTFDVERGGVRLAPQRARVYRSLMRSLHALHGEGLVVWPPRAGVHFLLDSYPASPRWRVPRTPAEDARWNAILESPSPPPVLLGASPSTLAQNLRQRAPRTFETLRRDFRVQGMVLAGEGNYRVLGRSSGSGSEPNLATQLPRIELLDANDVTPALREDLSIGQSFDVGDADLRGIATRFVTDADSVRLKMRLRVWQRWGEKFDTLLAAQNVEIVAGRGRPMHWFNVPVEETAGLHLAVTFEALEAPTSEVRMAWHDHDGPGLGRDLYESGTALLDLTPVPADLVLLVY